MICVTFCAGYLFWHVKQQLQRVSCASTCFYTVELKCCKLPLIEEAFRNATGLYIDTIFLIIDEIYVSL